MNTRMENQTDTPVEIVQVKRQMLYSVDHAPFPLLWPLIGMQQILVSVGSIVSTATLTAMQVGAGDIPEVRTQLLSIALFASGMATVLQNLLGSRLPVFHGSNASFIAPMVAIFSLSKWREENLLQEISLNNNTATDEPWKIRMREVQGNMMLASATQFVMGATGMIGFLLRFIGPMTVAPTITITGFYIGSFVIPLCEQHWGIAFLSTALLITIVLFLSTVKLPFPIYSKRNGCVMKRLAILQLVPVGVFHVIYPTRETIIQKQLEPFGILFLLAVCITWLLSYVLTVTDSLPSNSTLPSYKARTDVRLSAIYESPWFTLPLPFQFGMPTVSVAGCLGMLATTLVSIIKCTGDFITSARVAEIVPPPPHAINRGIAMFGLSSSIGAMLGDPCAPSPYSQNIGAIAITKVPSRKVFVTAGVLLMTAGVIGKVGAVFTIIPDPVIGGVTLVAMGMVAAAGLSTLQHVELNSSRNLLIIGTSMMFGLKIPDWMLLYPEAIKTGSAHVDQIMTVLLSNPMFVAGCLGCLLDNLAPGTEKERGIKIWRETLAASGMQYMTGEDTYGIPYITKFMKKIKCCSYFPMSPTFDKDIRCKCCFSKRPSNSSYSVNNAMDLNEIDVQ